MVMFHDYIKLVEGMWGCNSSKNSYVESAVIINYFTMPADRAYELQLAGATAGLRF